MTAAAIAKGASSQHHRQQQQQSSSSSSSNSASTSKMENPHGYNNNNNNKNDSNHAPSGAQQQEPKPITTTTKDDSKTTTTIIYTVSLTSMIWISIVLYSAFVIGRAAYQIRMIAIHEYGPVIHEFDPYFNYRATEYLYWNGAQRFFQWFDYQSWYPLGRPVGTTIYPGMQFVAVGLKHAFLRVHQFRQNIFLRNGLLRRVLMTRMMRMIGSRSSSIHHGVSVDQYPDEVDVDKDDRSWSLNDICCYIPAWFGVLATMVTGLIAYECCANSKGSSIVQWMWKLVEPLLSQPPQPHHHQRTRTTTTPSPNPTTTNNNNNTSSSSMTTTTTNTHTTAVHSALFAAGIMAIVPAHLMRSVGGGYDNESVATLAMVLTFYCWIRCLRHTDHDENNDHPHDNDHYHQQYSWAPQIWGAVWTALSYFFMVATWGGYVFVLNLIGLHALFLVLMGRFSTRVYLCYSVFYVLGTSLAIQVPVVGWAPLKSLEQLGPCAVFIAYQVLQYTECVLIQRHRRTQRHEHNNNDPSPPLPLTRREAWTLRLRVLGVGAGAGLLVIFGVLAPLGYFGPLSARVRGLFVQHTKTGNPLVDSVAEHQPASARAYFQYLHQVCTVAPMGYVFVLSMYWTNASSFLIVWATAAYFFSHKMVRLILLTGLIASVLAGIAVGGNVSWSIRQWWDSSSSSGSSSSSSSTLHDRKTVLFSDPSTSKANHNNIHSNNHSAKSGGGKGGKSSKSTKKAHPHPLASAAAASRSSSSTSTTSSFDGLADFHDMIESAFASKEGVFAQRVVALLALIMVFVVGRSFVIYSFRLAVELSHPSIILKARNHDNEIVRIDDYREAYWWLRDHTPTDARIMAWWDYGYQITAIANRTTLADGNTWNHEHIALLGKALTSPLDEGYDIARHWADYVLVWAGGRGDDLAKSPHLARIANSVYRNHCPDDPTCRAFGFLDRRGTPTTMMAQSLLYRLHSHQLKPGVEAPEDKFREVYKSKYGFVRIYQIMGVSDESKAWAANPANRVCDVPGGWFCRGQYPPGLADVLSSKTDFQQLEDFNIRGSPGDAEYQKRYFEDLKNPDKVKQNLREQERQRQQQQQQQQQQHDNEEEEPPAIDEIYNTWQDTEDTTHMWNLIRSENIAELKAWLSAQPHKAYIRSRDGRGPMWWAFEQRNEHITHLFMKAGVPHTDRDAHGLAPVDLLDGRQ